MDNIVRLCIEWIVCSLLFGVAAVRTNQMDARTSLALRLPYAGMLATAFGLILWTATKWRADSWPVLGALAATAALLLGTGALWKYGSAPAYAQLATPTGNTRWFTIGMGLVIGFAVAVYEAVVPSPRSTLVIHDIRVQNPVLRAGEPAILVFRMSKKQLCPTEVYGFWMVDHTNTYAARLPMFMTGAVPPQDNYTAELSRPTDMLAPGRYSYRSIIRELCDGGTFDTLSPDAEIEVIP